MHRTCCGKITNFQYGNNPRNDDFDIVTIKGFFENQAHNDELGLYSVC